RQVAWQIIKQRRDICRALNGRVSTQRHDTGARTAHIAYQQLQNCSGANELRAQGVLGKAQSISKDRRALRIGVLRNRLRQVVEVFLRDTAGLFHNFWRVARVVTLENLEDRIRVLQSLITLDIPPRTFGLLHVLPRVRDVLTGFWVVARKEAV